MTPPLLPVPPTQITDPATEARVRQNTETLMKQMGLDRAAAQQKALEYEGLAPTQTPTPDRRMEAGKGKRDVGELYLDALTGMLSTAARGVTLGATDNIPAMKESAAQYRRDNKALATVVELGAGMALNPLGKGLAALAKGAKAVPVLGRVAGALDRAANPTAARTAWEAFKSGAKAAGLYGGAYGFNTQTEGGLSDRMANAAVNAAVAIPTGGLLGVTLHKVSGMATKADATMRGKAAPPDPLHGDWQPSDESMQLLEKAFLVDRGKLPDASELRPGYTILDLLGPNGRQLFQEAARSSPRAIRMADDFRTSRFGATADEISGMLQHATGFPGAGAGRFNPVIQSRELVRQAQREGGPLFRAIDRANPEVPSDHPILAAVLKSPTIQSLLTSKQFRLFAENRAAADEVRQLMGGVARGAVQGGDELERALGGDVAAITKAFGRPPTPRELAQLPEPTRLTWRTLDNLRKKIDGHLSNEPSDQLANAANDDLKALRAGLVRALDDVIPGYQKARQAYADPLLAKEMMARGERAAQRADVVEADLADPELLVLGKAALDHYRLGVLGAIQRAAGSRPGEAAPNGFFTPDVRRIIKAISLPPRRAQVDDMADVLNVRHETATFAPTRTSEGLASRGERLKGAVEAGAGAVAAGAPWLAVRQMVSEVGRRGRKMPDLRAEELTSMMIPDNPYRVLEWLHARRMGFEAGTLAGQLAGRQTGISLNAPPQP